MKMNLITPIAVALTLGIVSTAQATSISHSTLGLLGADDYEAQPLGSTFTSQLSEETYGGEGAWDVNAGGAGVGNVVTSAGPTGAAQGSQFVTMFNAGTYGSGNYYNQRLDINDVGPGDAGDITTTFSFFVDSSPTAAQTGSFGFELSSTDTAGWAMLAASWDRNGGINVGCRNCTWVSGTIPTDEWLAAEIIYHLVDGTLNDTIDATISSMQGAGVLFSATGIAVAGDDLRNIQSANFYADNYGSVYLDAIPEPSTAAMLGIGALLFAGLRRRTAK